VTMRIVPTLTRRSTLGGGVGTDEEFKKEQIDSDLCECNSWAQKLECMSEKIIHSRA